MDNNNKIVVQYKPSEIDIFLHHADSEKKLSSRQSSEEITLQETKQKLYDLIVELQKKYKLMPVEISIQLSDKKTNNKKWKKFINEIFATTGAYIGLSRK